MVLLAVQVSTDTHYLWETLRRSLKTDEDAEILRFAFEKTLSLIQLSHTITEETVFSSPLQRYRDEREGTVQQPTFSSHTSDGLPTEEPTSSSDECGEVQQHLDSEIQAQPNNSNEQASIFPDYEVRQVAPRAHMQPVFPEFEVAGDNSGDEGNISELDEGSMMESDMQYSEEKKEVQNFNGNSELSIEAAEFKEKVVTHQLPREDHLGVDYTMQQFRKLIPLEFKRLTQGAMQRQRGLPYESPSTTPGIYPCGICGKMYRYSSGLQRHIREGHNERSHQCQLCNSVLKTERTLKDHMLHVHRSSTGIPRRRYTKSQPLSTSTDSPQTDPETTPNRHRDFSIASVAEGYPSPSREDGSLLRGHPGQLQASIPHPVS